MFTHINSVCTKITVIIVTGWDLFINITVIKIANIIVILMSKKQNLVYLK